MSALARYLLLRGNFVSGSDLVGGEQVYALKEIGVEITVGEDVVGEKLKTSDFVVYTDAVSKRNRELLLAKEMGKTIYSRAELLREICGDFSHILSVPLNSSPNPKSFMVTAQVLGSINFTLIRTLVVFSGLFGKPSKTIIWLFL